MSMKMTAKNIIKEEVILQLNRQGIIFEILNDEELNKIYEKWIEKFIGNKKAPILENYKWHIFSYNKKNLKELKLQRNTIINTHQMCIFLMRNLTLELNVRYQRIYR
jgi:hypothetical protein